MKWNFSKLSPLLLSLFLSCGDEPDNRVLKSQIIHEEMHLGEYLQVESPETLISVRRDGNFNGLARIFLTSNQIDYLDPTAKDARDIHLSKNIIAYRLGTTLKLWIDGNILQLIDLSVTRVRGIQTFSDFIRVYVDLGPEESRELKFDLNGSFIDSEILPGSFRASVLDSSGSEIAALQNSEGLSLWKRHETEWQKMADIEKGKIGSYVSMRFLNSCLWIGYFDETQGVLKVSSYEGGRVQTPQIVDGEPNKTYRGQDIALFNDRGYPGFIYLDAWALKIRMARLNQKGIWESSDLGLRGALGFYNQIIQENDHRLIVATHHFRTEHPSRSQSFENLGIVEIKLD